MRATTDVSADLEQPVQETPPAPLSIVHLCTPARVGGLERVVQGLATWTARAGHEVTVIAVCPPGTDLEEFEAPMARDRVPVLRLESRGRAYLRERRRVTALLRSLAPDVLHCHGYRTDLLHGGPARSQGIATVSTLHGSSRMGGLSHLFEWWQERALARFDAVIAVSEPLRRSLAARGVPADRLHLIPNGWVPPERYLDRTEARKELGVPEQGFLLGWIGRLIPIKGCDVFVEALALLGAEAPAWHAVIIGDGPERKALDQLARDRGVADRVTFTGSVPEAARIVQALDLFVLSSRSEGTPMTVLEVMGAGVPVVATEVGGVPEVVEPPVGGWLAPPEDPEALAGTLLEVLSDNAERSRRGREGKARATMVYGTGPWIAQHLRAYRAANRVRRKVA